MLERTIKGHRRMWTDKKGSISVLMLLFLLFLFITNRYFVGSASASYGPPRDFRWVDRILCGSGQPEGDEYRWLRDQGVRAIINLRLEYNGERSLVTSLGMEYLYIPVKDDDVPTINQVLTFLDYINEHNPALVHCAAGAGRTGIMIACYRIAKYGWSAQKATDEAIAHGMKPSEAQKQIQFIKDFEIYWKKGQMPTETPTWIIPLVLIAVVAVIGVVIIALMRRKSKGLSHRI
jgi:protein tyrosine phosphatase (PTP) superfamily phosphohydrolase (DUF442 family)